MANIAVILYSGPSTWAMVHKCTGKSEGTVNQETDCKIKIASHFTMDHAATKDAINALTWPKGSTLTSLALLAAKAELDIARPDTPHNIVVFTDGRPMSRLKTGETSAIVRKKARLLRS